jgi:protein ImuB
MSRVACVLVLHFAAAAAERVEPGLRERPLAIVTGAPPLTRLVEANTAAREHGVAPGMTEAEARTRCPTLASRPAAPELVEAAAQALLQSCLGVSPRIEDAGSGLVHVEIDGLERLIGHDRAIGDRLVRLTTRVGLPARIGIADSRVAARVAARRATAPVTVIPPGTDQASLASASFDLLELPDDLRATLARWGLTTLGELAGLPPRELADRLGVAGLRARDLARGRDLEPFKPYVAPPFWEEALGVDWEIDTIPALVVVLERLLARLSARLGTARLAADGLSLRLELASGGGDYRMLPLAYPLREPEPMLTLLRVSLEAHPPPAAVTHITLGASAVASRPAPRELWEPAGPPTRDLEAVLTRLVMLAGAQSIGSPVVSDSHRPDAFTLMPFVPPAGTPPLGTIPPPRVRLALRRLRPPRPIEVEPDSGGRGEGCPARVSLDGRRPLVRVLTCAGPWRLSGEWWDTEPWARDEWTSSWPTASSAGLPTMPSRMSGTSTASTTEPCSWSCTHSQPSRSSRGPSNPRRWWRRPPASTWACWHSSTAMGLPPRPASTRRPPGRAFAPSSAAS